MLTDNQAKIDSSMIKLKVEHAIQIIILVCSMFAVWSSSMAEIKANTVKIQSQKEYVKRIDSNVKVLIDHFISKGIDK